jgi:hypothetical protein
MRTGKPRGVFSFRPIPARAAHHAGQSPAGPKKLVHDPPQNGNWPGFRFARIVREQGGRELGQFPSGPCWAEPRNTGSITITRQARSLSPPVVLSLAGGQVPGPPVPFLLLSVLQPCDGRVGGSLIGTATHPGPREAWPFNPRTRAIRTARTRERATMEKPHDPLSTVLWHRAGLATKVIQPVVKVSRWKLCGGEDTVCCWNTTAKTEHPPESTVAQDTATMPDAGPVRNTLPPTK